jgi:hypothetical protein
MAVRPHEMATGTRTNRAGQYPLDSLNHYMVYVPKQCVGTKRCPLIVFLPGAGYGASQVMVWQRPVADKYGMIILSPIGDNPNGIVDNTYNRPRADTAMKQILRQFAIDPDKIALVGRCAGGPPAIAWGGANLDVFSRIVAISGSGWIDTTDMDLRYKKKTEYLIDGGILDFQKGIFVDVKRLRQTGFYVKHILSIRNHNHQAEDYDFVGHLLQESWAKPNPRDRHAPTVVADPVPVLTTDALAQMTAFWTSFMKEPDSIRTTARMAHLREVLIPVAEEQPSAPMVDIAALAAKYPSVASDLKAAGLTAQQHDAYRVALIGLITFQQVNSEQRHLLSVEAGSVLWQNIRFIKMHPDEFKALEATNIWMTP